MAIRNAAPHIGGVGNRDRLSVWTGRPGPRPLPSRAERSRRRSRSERSEAGVSRPTASDGRIDAESGKVAMAEVVLKVTPSLLRAADVMCARRLAREVDTEAERSGDPVNRSRLRDAFLATARDLHAELRSPTLADF